MIAARQLAREIWLTAGAIILVLLIVTVSVRLSGYLEDAANGRLAVEVLGRVLLLRLPEFLLVLGPLAFYAAVLLTLARYQADSEAVILHASGLGHAWWLRTMMLAALPAFALFALLSLTVVPAAKSAVAGLLAEQRGMLALGHLQPGRFQHLGDAAGVAWAREVDSASGRLTDVLLFRDSPSGDRSLIAARHGTFRIDTGSGVRRLILEDGHRYQLTAAPPQVRSAAFARLDQQLDPAAVAVRRGHAERRSSGELWVDTGADSRAELHWRLALPVLLPVLVLIGLALAGRPPGPVSWRRFLAAIIAFLALLLALVAGRSAVESGQAAPWLVIWLPLGGTGIAALGNWWFAGRWPRSRPGASP